MKELHPNVELLSRLDPRDFAADESLFSEGVVFHFFNEKLPELQGDYVGLAGIGKLFTALQQRSGGTFRVEPVSVTPYGDEIVVTHSKNCLTLDGRVIEVDAVVVWRIVENEITEIWDIPAVHTPHVE